MVDYKKWDRFVAELSDDDEDFRNPMVHTFDKDGGETIEINNEGFKVKEKAPTSASAPKSIELAERNHITPSTNASQAKLEVDDSKVINCDSYSWSQDRHEVVISIPIEESQRGKDINVSIKGKKIQILGSDNTVILDKVLQFDIDRNNEDGEVDWEIISKSNSPSSEGKSKLRKCIRVTLRKKSPIPGAVFWWKNVFVGDPEIDVTKIQGRNSKQGLELQDAWKDSHQKFIDSIANREKITVEI